MDLNKTERGFYIAEFKDRYDKDCSIQESSLATEGCIWLGQNDVDGKPARMHLTVDMVKELLPLLQIFVETGCLYCNNTDPDGKY